MSKIGAFCKNKKRIKTSVNESEIISTTILEGVLVN